LIKLAPDDLEFTEIAIKDLPLYSYDYDADFPPAGRAPEAYVKFNPAFFADDGTVTDEGAADFLRQYMEEYGAFVERVLAANAPGHIGDLKPDAAKLSR
jgi:hypothetical protein